MKLLKSIIILVIAIILVISIFLVLKKTVWVSEEDILRDIENQKKILDKSVLSELYYPQGKENYTKEQVIQMIKEMEKNPHDYKYNQYLTYIENEAPFITDEARKVLPDTYNLRTKIEKDEYRECLAETRKTFKPCKDDILLYNKAQCMEGYYLFKALKANDASLCKELGTHKINNWCVAYLTSNSKICEDKDMENEVFRTVCYALAEKNISRCEGMELACHYDYYVISGVGEDNPSICDGMEDQGDAGWCKAVVSSDGSYCKESEFS